MSDTAASLLASFAPLLLALLVLFVMVSFTARQATKRYNAQAARLQASVERQTEAVALQKQTNALLQEIRDSLRDK